jgi:AcrR family transcriptional regulator
MQRLKYCALMHEVAPGGLRERKKLRTREAIVSAALKLFARDGYEGTTVAGIAAAADVSERTVYTYFAAKEDVLFADHADFERELRSALDSRTGEVSALDVLRETIVENLSRFDDQSRLRWQVVSRSESLRARERARQGVLGAAIADAIAADLGEQPDDLRPQLVTAAVIAAFTATYEHRWRARSRAASRAQAVAVVDETIAFLRGGLEAIRAYPKPY